MLEFFRRPAFWLLLGGLVAAMVLSGYWWASGVGWRRGAAASMLLAGITLAGWIGVKLGILAAAVAVVTGIIVGALGLELGADRAPSHAVVVDSDLDSVDGADSVRDVRLAS